MNRKLIAGKVQTTMRFDAKLLDEIDNIADQLSMTRTTLIEKSMRLVIRQNMYNDPMFNDANLYSSIVDRQIESAITSALNRLGLNSRSGNQLTGQSGNKPTRNEHKRHGLTAEEAKTVYSNFYTDFIVIRDCISYAISNGIYLADAIKGKVTDSYHTFVYFTQFNEHVPSNINGINGDVNLTAIPVNELTPYDLITDHNHQWLKSDIDPYISW